MKLKAYVWRTPETGCAVIALAKTIRTARKIVLSRYPQNPKAVDLVARKPIVHKDLELIYVFGDYII